MNQASPWFALAAALVVSAFALPAHANLIQNGSFEDPVVTVGFYKNFLSGSTEITGWKVVGIDSSVANGTFVQSGITFQAQDGVQWIDLAGITSNSKTSGVTQSFASSVGTEYEITFYVASATDRQLFFPATVELSINGGARSSYFNPAAPTTSLDWKLFTVDFVATTTTTSLTFFNGSESNNFLGGLDNVSVEAVAAPVPEPSEYAMLLMGLAAIGGLQRLRRSQA